MHSIAEVRHYVETEEMEHGVKFVRQTTTTGFANDGT